MNTRPDWVQVYEKLKTCLESRTWPAGTKLPSTKQLATTWHTHDVAVHKAMQQLVKDGYLERRQPIGTFVREQTSAPKTIGIYYTEGLLAAPEHRFLRAVHQALIDRMRAAGIPWRLWTDSRPAAERVRPAPALMTAIQQHDIDALIAPITEFPNHNWLLNLPLPTACMDRPSVGKNVVTFNGRELVELALRELADQGCRSVGMIAPYARRRGPSAPCREDTEVYRTFRRVCRERGLQTKASWIATRESAPSSYEQWGYDAFGAIWDQAKRPDGLLVEEDVSSIGVTHAVLERGVRIPTDLRLVYAKNAEVDLFCTLPVTYVVVKATDAARSLLELIERQFAGEPVQPVVLGCEVWRPPQTVPPPNHAPARPKTFVLDFEKAEVPC